MLLCLRTLHIGINRGVTEFETHLTNLHDCKENVSSKISESNMHSFQSEQPPYANNKPNKSTPFVDTLTPMVSSEPQQHSDFSVRRHENKNNREFDQTLIHSIP